MKTIDNFEQIKELLQFDSEDDFYYLQIIKRKKEHRELGSNSYIVKTYYIKTKEDLDFYKGEIVCLCNFHNARACINLNRRSFEKIAFQNLRKTTDIIMNKDYKSVRKAYNSVCGTYSSEKNKKWILDIDEKEPDLSKLYEYIRSCEPNAGQYKHQHIIETKNGWHLITAPFNNVLNGEQFKQVFPDIEVHKDNPTILYCLI